MTTTPSNQKSRVATVQVWGKGYRVTADSEEFQRYVPQQAPQVTKLESIIGSISWGRVLEPLYAITNHELAGQRAMMFDTSGLVALSFARTEDRHRRSSLVLTTASIEIDWNSEELSDTASRITSLALRLSSAYAETFRGNPESVGQQLRTSTFLPSPAFDLTEEESDRGVDWTSVLTAVKQWRGISGVATAKLLSLGANIVLGTKHEAERAQQQFSVDGYFDVREKEIRPLSANLTRWKDIYPETVATQQQPIPTTPPPLDLRPVVDSLDRIDRSLNRLGNVMAEILELVFRDKRRR